MPRGFQLSEGEYLLRNIEQAVIEAPLFPPVRKIKGRRHGPMKISVTSRKNKKNMNAFENLLLEGHYELGAFYWLESNASVLWYKPQPFTVRFHDGNRITSYVGDFLAAMNDGTYTLFEVKKSTNLDDPAVASRLARLKGAFAKTDVAFEVLESNVLNAKPKFDTLLKLYGQTASAIVGSSALEAAKNEVLKSLRYLGGKADFDELQSSSPFINEAGVAMALFDGLVTSSFKFPMGKLFDISLTSLGERECQH